MRIIIFTLGLGFHHVLHAIISETYRMSIKFNQKTQNNEEMKVSLIVFGASFSATKLYLD